MITRFQRLTFALGLSLLIGAIAGKIFQNEYCTYNGEKFGCNYLDESLKVGEAIRITEYNTSFAFATASAVFGICLMIIALIKEDIKKISTR